MAKKQRKFQIVSDQDVDLARTKKFNPGDLVDLVPLTDNQAHFFDLYDSQTPLIFQSGAAGTGKTFLAIGAALRSVFEGDQYHRVILVRSAVEGRKQGFQPGDEEEKMAPYEVAYRVICNELIRSYKNSYENLKALGYFEFTSTSFKRGLTWDNAIVIIDEVTNLDETELKMILTRVGTNSRVIICGDVKQNDLARTREVTCFGYLEKLIEELPEHFAGTVTYTMEDCVRSGFVKEILKADDKISSQ